MKAGVTHENALNLQMIEISSNVIKCNNVCLKKCVTNLRCSRRLGDHRGDERLQKDEREHNCQCHVEFAFRFQWEKHRRNSRNGHEEYWHN